MESRTFHPTRIIVARLDEGDDLLLSIQRCAEEHRVTAGVISVIGGLKVASYALYRKGEYFPIKKSAKNCFELLHLAGNISLREGKVFIHAHLTSGNEANGGAFGGHLLEGSIISPFAELCIQAFDGTISRTFDKEINLWSIKF